MTVYTFGYVTIFEEISLKRGEITQILGNENESGAHMKNTRPFLSKKGLIKIKIVA